MKKIVNGVFLLMLAFVLSMGAQVNKKNIMTKRTNVATVHKKLRIRKGNSLAKTVMPKLLPVVIEGTVSGLADGKEVYLGYLHNNRLNNFDSVRVSNEGKFVFKGRCETVPMICLLSTGEKEHFTVADFFLESGTIKANLVLDHQLDNITGTPMNNVYAVYKDTINRLRAKIIDQHAVANKGATAESRKQALLCEDSLVKRYTTYTYDFLDKNMSNLVGIYILSKQFNIMPLEKCDSLLSKIPEKYDKIFTVEGIRDYVKRKKKTMPGQSYIDFSAKTLEGRSFVFSDFVRQNKYVLLHFWAKWSLPSFRDVSYMVTAYQKYKEKGLGIVSFSLDTDTLSWAKAVKDFYMNWPQVTDDKGRESQIVKEYNVDTLPTTIIINDAPPKIIARNLCGEALKIKLDELFK